MITSIGLILGGILGRASYRLLLLMESGAYFELEDGSLLLMEN